MNNVDQKVLRVRLMGAEERLGDLAEELVGVIEASGYECIEWTRAFPCREPDGGKSKLFLTFIVRGENDKTDRSL